MTEVRVVLVTVPDEESGLALARSLVGERLAACVNLVPGLRSIYRWQGGIEETGELLLLLKTRAELVDDLTRRVAELHPYDLPEVLALGVSGGLSAYLDWVGAETSAP